MELGGGETPAKRQRQPEHEPQAPGERLGEGPRVQRPVRGEKEGGGSYNVVDRSPFLVARGLKDFTAQIRVGAGVLQNKDNSLDLILWLTRTFESPPSQSLTEEEFEKIQD